MKKTIFLKKATRIEGNATIKIDLKDGRVDAARMEVPDFRGFEKFTQGRRIEFVPTLVSRICGLCCASHQVASLKALEAALDVSLPRSIELLRQIIVMGEWISSHALSFFFLSLPDFRGTGGGFFELMEKRPEVAKEALALRSAGQQIVHCLGKRASHPVSLGLGRFLSPISADDLTEIERLAYQAKAGATDLAVKCGLEPLESAQITLPSDQPLNFFSCEEWLDDGQFKARDRKGNPLASFDREAFADNISEIKADWSMAKFPYLKAFGFPQGIMVVGPLARFFAAGGIMEDPEIKHLELAQRLKEISPLTLESFDVCRLLEIIWAANRILERVQEVDTNDLTVDVDPEASGYGVGVIEAPRGVLVHEYLVNRGHMEKARLMVATQFNNAYINLLIRNLAETNVAGDKLSPEGERLLGRCIRVFDPCLSCATH